MPKAGGVAELVVAIPTFRRPDALANVLTAVREQVDAENGLPEDRCAARSS